MSQGFDDVFALVEKVINMFNESLAEDIERLECLIVETGDGREEARLAIDLAGLMESAQEAAKEQVAYLVDMAKAEALDLLGETRQVLELVDRYV